MSGATIAEVKSRPVLATLLLLVPGLIIATCFAQFFGLINLPQWLRASTVFALLISLMLTGMPISIALGLTVLLFTLLMTPTPVQTVALKLFTGIEKFEIMAIPFFILAGNFLTHGGVAKRMINFATAMSVICTAASVSRRSWPAPCSRLSPDRRLQPWSPSAPSSCRPWSHRVSPHGSARAS